MKPLILLPESVEDVAEAYEWWERRKSGLGREFIECVEACLAAVQENPRGHGFAHANYRRAKVRRFPYIVFYREDDESVKIYAVFHCARDPRKWQRRLA